MNGYRCLRTICQVPLSHKTNESSTGRENEGRRAPPLSLCLSYPTLSSKSANQKSLRMVPEESQDGGGRDMALRYVSSLENLKSA